MRVICAWCLEEGSRLWSGRRSRSRVRRRRTGSVRSMGHFSAEPVPCRHPRPTAGPFSFLALVARAQLVSVNSLDRRLIGV
jgi:hypothetical protein